MDPFRLEEKLGSGAKSEVWRAVHTASGLPVAVKIITAREARRPEIARRIENEVRSIAALDHPNVIALFDYGRADGRPYLVMELASGGTLDRIKPLRRYEDLRAVLLALLDALAHAHARGVIHRDLTPRNILIAKKFDMRPGIKIADFGIAVPLQRGARAHSREAAVVGTLGYMAPEQLRARWRDYGPWTDLFSLGLIAQRLATGRAPYREGKPTETFEARLLGERAPLDPSFPLPLGFPEWLDRMLDNDPARRFQLAADAAFALAELGTPDQLDDFEDGSSTVRAAIEAIERRTISVAKSWRYPRPPPPPLPLSSIGSKSAHEGTDEERDRIWELVQLTTIDGRAREGKSRLAEWVAERALELGACTVLRATDGIGAMLDRFFHSDGLDGSETLAHVRSRLSWYGMGDEILARALTRWMRPNVGTEEDELSADGLELLRKFIARLGETRPVLIVVDGANADARAFMKYVLASKEKTRVLFVLASP
jgi:eukaryotic-like serine/threonine-protein kinase